MMYLSALKTLIVVKIFYRLKDSQCGTRKSHFAFTIQSASSILALTKPGRLFASYIRPT